MLTPTPRAPMLHGGARAKQCGGENVVWVNHSTCAATQSSGMAGREGGDMRRDKLSKFGISAPAYQWDRVVIMSCLSSAFRDITRWMRPPPLRNGGRLCRANLCMSPKAYKVAKPSTGCFVFRTHRKVVSHQVVSKAPLRRVMFVTRAGDVGTPAFAFRG